MQPPTHPPSLAFFGGCWGTLLGIGFLFTHLLMVVSPLATLTKLYLFFFSVITMTVESDGETVSANLKAFILKQCKALSYVQSRGLFYLYIGTSGILGGKLVKRRFFGWYMLSVGFFHIILHYATKRYIKDLHSVFSDDAFLVSTFNRHAKGRGWLDREQLIALLEDVNMLRSHQEIELLFDVRSTTKTCNSSTHGHFGSSYTAFPGVLCTLFVFVAL